MSRFLQLHLLTSYPPANLNRDDLGRPKTAKMGGSDRLRVSSQSLKRAWRTSDLFQSALQGAMGERTKLLGVQLFLSLIEKHVDFKMAVDTAGKLAGVFGKNEAPDDLKKKKDPEKQALYAKLQKKWRGWNQQNLGIAEYSLEQLNELQKIEISQLAFVSPEEKQKVFELVDLVASGGELGEKLDILCDTTSAVDVALFGRMLADHPSKNIEAACQVAHAISVHPITIEDDYFTAVDDLNSGHEDAGAAHIGETGFAAGLFYSYICINKELLVENLNGDKTLASRAIAALVEAAAKVAPEGKQNSFASRAYASYVLAEAGDQQPRSLSVAFLKPVGRQIDDYQTAAIEMLNRQQQNFDQVYGDCADARYAINAVTGEGSLKELLAFASK
ncbi:type I-E CRISPR-associated protein Cas7/Cse4/CasC [Endozoicomonas sp. SESOKO1]|uniref:type I-E CRISPR-associated protein Cas7/Cse4/CasC n=1 Tax=Endozoicomonas sp. SESOKO1 TaxID=2828742 RepID=UPI002148D3EF|nr:type I-E CRISPR-associated protein Cas7/Cse4/CasC [Endozoicomonas sp. SESOKO1]